MRSGKYKFIWVTVISYSEIIPMKKKCRLSISFTLEINTMNCHYYTNCLDIAKMLAVKRSNCRNIGLHWKF